MTHGRFAVVPAFGEEASIAKVVRGTIPHVDRVLVVDDGSSDATAREAEAAGATVLRHESNRGKGASLVTGLQAALGAGAAMIATLDGDGQHDPADLPRLFDELARHPRDLVLGARLEGRETVPGARRFGNAQANFWLSWACGQPLADSQTGLRAIRPDLLARTLPRCLRRRRFVFESAFLIEAARQGALIRHVPIRACYEPGARRSHYRPAADTLPIIAMVTLELLARRTAPLGLMRALGLLPVRRRC